MPVGVCLTNADQHTIHTTWNGAEKGFGIASAHLMPAQTIAQKVTEKKIYFVFLLTEFLKNFSQNSKK